MCPLKCTEVTYQLIPKTVVRLDYSAHYASVRIYYDSFNVKVIKDVAEVTSLSLFASIGGILGILLGTSVISFIEIFQIILYCFYMTVKFLVSKIKREDQNKVADGPKIIMEPIQIENTAEPEPIKDVDNDHVSGNKVSYGPKTIITPVNYDEIKKGALKLFSDASMHGLSQIVAAKSAFEKLFWAILILAAGCYSFSMVFGYVSTYLEYPVLKVLEIVHEDKPEFPKINMVETFSNTDYSSKVQARFGKKKEKFPESIRIKEEYRLTVGFDWHWIFNSGIF